MEAKVLFSSLSLIDEAINWATLSSTAASSPLLERSLVASWAAKALSSLVSAEPADRILLRSSSGALGVCSISRWVALFSSLPWFMAAMTLSVCLSSALITSEATIVSSSRSKASSRRCSSVNSCSAAWAASSVALLSAATAVNSSLTSSATRFKSAAKADSAATSDAKSLTGSSIVAALAISEGWTSGVGASLLLASSSRSLNLAKDSSLSWSLVLSLRLLICSWILPLPDLSSNFLKKELILLTLLVFWFSSATSWASSLAASKSGIEVMLEVLIFSSPKTDNSWSRAASAAASFAALLSWGAAGDGASDLLSALLVSWACWAALKKSMTLAEPASEE